MIKRRSSHASVSMGNKLFVIGGNFSKICEIFDSFSRKFTLIKIKFPEYNFALSLANKVASRGSFIFVISKNNNDTALYIYDVENHCWSQTSCSVLKNLTCMSCVKYYID